LALKHKGVVGVDFESRSFFREAKKAGYKVSALYIVTDLPLKKPFYRKRSKRETLKITHAIEQIKQQLGKL
jgi:purine-nucleoside phosphorylase